MKLEVVLKYIYLVFLGYSWDSFGASTIRSSRKSFRNRSRGMAGIGLSTWDRLTFQGTKVWNWKCALISNSICPSWWCTQSSFALQRCMHYCILLFEAIDGSSLWLYVNIILPSCQSLTHPSKHPAEPSGVAYCELSSGTGAWSARLDSLTWHADTEDHQRALKLYLIYIYKRLNFKQC